MKNSLNFMTTCLKVVDTRRTGRTIFLNETCASVLRQMADHLHENSAARYDDLDGPLTNLMQNFTAAGLTPLRANIACQGRGSHRTVSTNPRAAYRIS